jgi:hypothetical protein
MNSSAEQFWIDSASSAARNPAAWYGCAQSLWRAAGILRATWEADLAALAQATAIPEKDQSTYEEFMETLASSEYEVGDVIPIPPAMLRLSQIAPPPPSVGRVFMLLAGYAFEALIKGIAVAEKPECVQPKPKDTNDLFNWGHGIRQILKDTGFIVDSAEDELLRRLEIFILWGGRYPVAKKATAMKYDPKTPPPASFSSDDFPRIDALWERLLLRIEASAQARQAKNDHLDAVAKQIRRSELMEELKQLTRHEIDGVVWFEDPAGADEPGALIVCCSCTSQFILNARRPAQICKCDTLHYCEPYFDGALDRWMARVMSYPPENKPL